MENSSFGFDSGCNFCGEAFYYEPPPDDIMIMPSPPLHPSFQGSIADMISSAADKAATEHCNFCSLLYMEGEQLVNQYNSPHDMNNPVVALLIAFLCISAIIFIYLIGTRRSRIIASFARSRLFKSDHTVNVDHQLGKHSSNDDSLPNSGVHLTDPCFLQTNRDKNLTSPMISDHVSHKKTSIPSKYWAQPSSVIGRAVGPLIPNEYEVPSSRTNSTGTSSAVYADNENNSRFFSPYNLHTYAEVREVLDPNEQFHTSSNSSAMLTESNYDNAIYSHGGCILSNGVVVTSAPNGSVQMSDFNLVRPVQSFNYGHSTSMNNQNRHHHHINQAQAHHNGPTVYEQPPQRAQIIITSNNQGTNPTLINYKERIHNVI